MLKVLKQFGSQVQGSGTRSASGGGVVTDHEVAGVPATKVPIAGTRLAVK